MRIILCSLLLWPLSAFGLYDPTPWSFEKKLNEELSLVMIGPPLDGGLYYFLPSLSSFVTEREQEVRRRFMKSGLYRYNNGIPEPVWTFDRHSRSFDNSPDGRYLVSMDYIWQVGQIGTQHNPNYGHDRLIRFYDSGRLINEHNITQLLNGSDYGDYNNLVSHFWWHNHLYEAEKAEWGIENSGDKFRFMSQNGDVLIFELISGSILSRYNLFTRIKWVVVIGLCAIALLAFAIWRIRPNKAAQETPDSATVPGL